MVGGVVDVAIVVMVMVVKVVVLFAVVGVELVKVPLKLPGALKIIFVRLNGQ